MTEPEKGFWQQVADDLGIDTKSIAEEFRLVKDEFSSIQQAFKDVGLEIQEEAWKALTEADKQAAWLALKREELWEKNQVNDRLAGAAIVGKFGILAGPLAKVAIPVAAVYGFVNGPKIVKKHDEWLKKHKPDGGTHDDDPAAPKPKDGP